MLFSSLAAAAGLLSLASASPVGQARSLKVDKRDFSAGPLLPDNFPDPSFIKVSDTYYAFATNTAGVHSPVATSPDFVTWTLLDGHDALPTVGAWSTGANVWASDVIQLADDSFILYYSAESTDTSVKAGQHCVGAATASTVEGPYTPVDNALACPLAQGGAIDPAGFIDADGTVYVVYKIDGNNIGNGGNCGNGDGAKATPLMLQLMQSDGVTLNGDPEQILDRDDGDGPLIEAPSLSRIADDSSDGGWLYFVFFSSNCYNSSLYDTSYAYSTTSVHGPYTKASEPLLVTGTNGLFAPGGMDTAIDIGLENNVVFHADKEESSVWRVMWGGKVNVDVAGRKITI